MGSPSAVYKEIITEGINKFNRNIEFHNANSINPDYIINESQDYTKEQLTEIARVLYKTNKPLMTFFIGWATGEFFESCSNDELNAGIGIISDILELLEIDYGDYEDDDNHEL